MNEKNETIEFFIQGSAANPYRVLFWREGNNVKSSCNCQAGKNGLACKHRLGLIDGDITNLVSSSADGLNKLLKIVEGSDVGAAICALDSIAPLTINLEKLLSLAPQCRRKSVSAEILSIILIQGGLIKGNHNYYDIFSIDLTYQGSVKVKKGTVFSETPSSYFPSLDLEIRRLTDGLIWEKSQSIYAAIAGSTMALTIDCNFQNKSKLKNLKKSLTD